MSRINTSDPTINSMLNSKFDFFCKNLLTSSVNSGHIILLAQIILFVLPFSLSYWTTYTFVHAIACTCAKAWSYPFKGKCDEHFRITYPQLTSRHTTLRQVTALHNTSILSKQLHGYRKLLYKVWSIDLTKSVSAQQHSSMSFLQAVDKTIYMYVHVLLF